MHYLRQFSFVFFLAVVFTNCTGDNKTTSSTTDLFQTPQPHQVSKKEIDLTLQLMGYFPNGPLIGLPLHLQITLLNPKAFQKRQEALSMWYDDLEKGKPKKARNLSEFTNTKVLEASPVILGQDWNKSFSIVLQKENTLWETQAQFKYETVQHRHLDEAKLDATLLLLLSIDTLNLAPGKYKVLVSADSAYFYAQEKELVFELKNPTSNQERSSLLYFQAEKEQDTQEALRLINDLLTLNEAYRNYSGYFLKAIKFEEKAIEFLDKNDLHIARYYTDTAINELLTFFSKNNLNVNTQDKRDWNDFLVRVLQKYDSLKRLQLLIEEEMTP